MIIGDWGNTQLRLWRLSEDGAAGPARLGKGVSQLECGELQCHLIATLGDWDAEARERGVLLCGAGGSNIGLFEVGYLDCPTGLAELATMRDSRKVNGMAVSILPGLSCTNVFDRPDRLRGEETQLLGAMEWGGLAPDGLACLPGTHPKWVHVRDRRIEGFTSTLTGEVFSLLKVGSIIVPDKAAPLGDRGAFLLGAEASLKDGAGALLSNLFALRASQIAGTSEPRLAGDVLSGMLIGADVGLAMEAYGGALAGQPVTLIGGEALCQRYGAVLQLMGHDTLFLEGDAMVVAGLTTAARSAA